MINMRDILDRFATTLAATAALDTWCQTHFGKDATIFVGFDVRDPPGKTSAPFIILQPGAANEGDEMGMFTYMVTVDWCIVVDTSTTAGQVREIDGLKLADELGRIILEALRGASQNVVLSSWNYSIEPVEFFPMIMAGLDITLNVPHLIGGRVEL